MRAEFLTFPEGQLIDIGDVEDLRRFRSGWAQFLAVIEGVLRSPVPVQVLVLRLTRSQQAGVGVTDKQRDASAKLPLQFYLQHVVVRPTRSLHGLANVVVQRIGTQGLAYRSSEGHAIWSGRGSTRPGSRNVVLRRERRG